MNLKYLIILATVTCSVATSCVKDTCNGTLGNTFEAIEIDSAYLNTDDLVTLSASMVTLDDLPAEYFEAVIAIDTDTTVIINSIVATKTNIKLTMVNSIVPEVNEDADLSFDFMFGDRKTYIDCKHSGSSDAYFLELTFNLNHLEGGQFEISNFTWSEIFAAGHL